MTCITKNAGEGARMRDVRNWCENCKNMFKMIVFEDAFSDEFTVETVIAFRLQFPCEV